jgi:hypothetical protein
MSIAAIDRETLSDVVGGGKDAAMQRQIEIAQIEGQAVTDRRFAMLAYERGWTEKQYSAFKAGLNKPVGAVSTGARGSRKTGP